MSTRRQQNEEDLRSLVRDFQRLEIARRDERQARRTAARDAQEPEHSTSQALAQLREQQHNVWRERERTRLQELALARERAEEADPEVDEDWERMVVMPRVAGRLAAAQERSRRDAEALQQAPFRDIPRFDDNHYMGAEQVEQRAALRNRLEQYTSPPVRRQTDDEARRADEDRARRQRLIDDLSDGDRALRRRYALIAQQNRERDLRAERRAVPLPDVPLPDVPLPNVPAISRRVAQAFAAALAWLRRRAEVSEEDQLIRDGEDVPDDRGDDSQTCTTCLVNKRAVICLPCGHCTQCNACYRRWKNAPDIEGHFHGPTCPNCRQMAMHTLPITQKERDALSADTVVRHAGSQAHRVPPGPIFMKAQMPGAPLLSMHSLLDPNSP